MQDVLSVGSLILAARVDAALEAALRARPEQVAQAKNLPAQVATSAAYALRELPKTKEGIWM